jgi:glycosyltransferase involved in cell wall biosynthesis
VATPAVSVITPTYRRDALLRLQYGLIARQTLADFEWLILDDSPQPSAYFLALDDPRVRYHHQGGQQMTIGVKRNWLAERAQAPVIAHFDDDDYYAPHYLETMLARLGNDDADLVKLTGWFLYTAVHGRFAYWDTVNTRGLHFRFAREGIAPAMFGEAEARTFAQNYLGYGYSLVYRKAVWQQIGFPEVEFNEDFGFAATAVARGAKLAHFSDSQGIAMQIMRRDAHSIAFPQFLLPDFLLDRLFPDAKTLLHA